MRGPHVGNAEARRGSHARLKLSRECNPLTRAPDVENILSCSVRRGWCTRNHHVICASVARAFPNGPGKGYRLVADFPPINGQPARVGAGVDAEP